MTDETQKELQVQAPAVLSAPQFYGASFNVSWSSNDCSLVVSRLVPTGVASPEGDGQLSLIHPQCILHMSVQSAKDLMLVLADGLERYEKEWGEVQTDFTRARK